MRSVIFCLLLGVCFVPFSFATEAEADNLYERRGENLENARGAAAMYSELAEGETDVMAKARLLKKQVTAHYYVGNQLERLGEKGPSIGAFAANQRHADALVDAVEGSYEADPTNLALEELYAWGLLYRSVNKAAWARVQASTGFLGKSKAVLKLKDVRRNANKVIDMGYESLYEYGAHRVLGRVEYSSPTGKKEKSKEYLDYAFNNTLLRPGALISVNGLNNIFFGDTLMELGEKDRACAILTAFIGQDTTMLLQNRIPEYEDEKGDARERVTKWECDSSTPQN